MAGNRRRRRDHLAGPRRPGVEPAGRGRAGRV